MALGRQMQVDLVAARSGLISEAQFGALGLEFPGYLVQGLQVAANPPVKSDLGTRTWLGNGYVNRHLMDIQPHIQYTFSHGLPPWVWLCAVGHLGSQLNPRCKVRRPLTFNHYVYPRWSALVPPLMVALRLQV